MITFGDLLFKPNEKDFFAEKPLNKIGIAAIGIVAKSENWYQGGSVFKLYQKVESILMNYTNRVMYGGSMGGYAAIKFSKLFSATQVISFCPQWSLDPGEWGRNNFSFESYFNDSMRGMGIRRGDASGDIYIFVDKNDHHHFSKIQDNIDKCYCVKVPFIGHHITTAFAGTSRLEDIIHAAIKKDLLSLYKISRHARKSFGYHVERLENFAIKKYPTISATKIINKEVVPSNSMVVPVVACVARDLGLFDYAKQIINEFFKRSGLSPDVLSTVFTASVILGKDIGMVTHQGKWLSLNVATMSLCQSDVNARSWEFPVYVDPNNTTQMIADVWGKKLGVHQISEGRFSIREIASTNDFVVEFIPAVGNKFYLKNNDRYLCVEPTGRVDFNRIHASAWEEFYFQMI